MNGETGYVVTTAPGSAQAFLGECRSTPGLTLVQNLEDNRFLCRFGAGAKTVFARHRFPVAFSTALSSPESPNATSSLLLEKLDLSSLQGRPTSLQVTASWPLGWTGQELWERLGLSDEPADATSADMVLSVYLHRWCDTHTLYAGVSTVLDNLSPWPAGECPLESTLLEAEAIFGPLGASGTALDLGAAPGGWTGLLAQRGYQVDAVDPSPLDTEVAKLAGVTEHSTTAAEFLEKADSKYDLIMCDMEVGSGEAIESLVKARLLLNPDGRLLAVLNLRKGRTVLAEARKAVAILGQTYQVCRAQRLHSNGSAITVLLQ